MTLDEAIEDVERHMGRGYAMYEAIGKIALPYMRELAHLRAADERREAWQTRAACVLRDVEWIGEDDSDDNPCPYCDMTRRNGHSAECTLAALLKEADK